MHTFTKGNIQRALSRKRQSPNKEFAMAISTKNCYPKAIPCRSPEELALHNSRLAQSNDELTAHAKRLQEHNEELSERSESLRRWTVRLAGGCVGLVMLIAGSVTLAIQYPSLLVSASPD